MKSIYSLRSSQSPGTRNMKKTTLRHIKINLLKTSQKRILKAVRKKVTMYKGIKIRMTVGDNAFKIAGKKRQKTPLHLEVFSQ